MATQLTIGSWRQELRRAELASQARFQCGLPPLPIKRLKRNHASAGRQRQFEVNSEATEKAEHQLLLKGPKVRVAGCPRRLAEQVAADGPGRFRISKGIGQRRLGCYLAQSATSYERRLESTSSPSRQILKGVAPRSILSPYRQARRPVRHESFATSPDNAGTRAVLLGGCQSAC